MLFDLATETSGTTPVSAVSDPSLAHVAELESSSADLAGPSGTDPVATIPDEEKKRLLALIGVIED